MESELQGLREQALAEIEAAPDATALESLRVKYLGRAGSISRASESMREVPKEDRPRFGKLLNEVRGAVQAALESRTASLVAETESAALGKLDLSLPGDPQPVGGLHPLTILQDRAIRVLRRMGFQLADGPDVEDEWHCFDALNTPPDHPARNEQDTFYLPDGRLLRTQTSTIQVRVMESQPPPVRIIAPGSCYRRDETDATHLAQFSQIEGLYVAPEVTVADLKETATEFLRGLLGPATEVRLRPHFFPFTEPSFEIDVRSSALGGGRWLEMAGCGMVDPAVFEAVNRARGDLAYDPAKFSGFAFGFGLERLAMIMAGLPDIRLLVENDVRFLAQFAR